MEKEESLDKMIDSFFDWILRVQHCLRNAERKYQRIKRYAPGVYIITIFASCIFLVYINPLIAYVLFFGGLVFCYFDSIIRWKNSVRAFLKTCLIYNAVISLFLTAVIQGMFTGPILGYIFLASYLIIWSFVSLVSYSKVSLLSNEIVSGISATLFTIITCILSISRDNHKLQYIYEEIRNQFLDCIESFAYSLLPVIGISALCVVLIKIKIYWMEKNGINELESPV